MNDDIRVSGRRRKVWQIESAYHCALIGTCLSRTDLRRIKRRKVFGFGAAATDYEVHKELASIIRVKNNLSRALQKVFDAKYNQAVKRYKPLKEQTDIKKQWAIDIANNDVSGAFWAILTHQLADQHLLDQVYGDCHMLSFDIFNSQRKEKSITKKLQHKLNQLELRCKKSDDRLKKEQSRCKDQLHRIKELVSEKTWLANEHKKLATDNENFEKKSKINHQSPEVIKLQQQLVDTQAKVQEYRIKYDASKAQAEIYRKNEKRIEVEMDNLSNIIATLKAEENVPEYLNYQGLAGPCDNCETPECNNPELCGKTILYVGGLHRMIELYRDLVEQKGGKFLHHDGGKQDSQKKLPKLLSGADAVLCPVDCISHNASKCVKKVCKRFSKPFVMMRSSGLSSFEKGLKVITQ